MTETQRAAMRMALECLKGVARGKYDGNAACVCAALEAALAGPEPEPVAGYRSCPTHCCPVHGCKYGHLGCPVHLGQVKPEYPHNNGCEYCESKPEPEPVAWIGKNGFRFLAFIEPQDDSEMPLYTAPPARQPLTNEEIDQIADSVNPATPLQIGKRLFARAIERAHGITGGDDE